MTSSNGNMFRVTGPLCWEFTGHRWIPHTEASDAELWCLFFICAWMNAWVNNREAGDLRRLSVRYDVIVMSMQSKHETSKHTSIINGSHPAWIYYKQRWYSPLVRRSAFVNVAYKLNNIYWLLKEFTTTWNIMHTYGLIALCLNSTAFS